MRCSFVVYVMIGAICHGCSQSRPGMQDTTGIRSVGVGGDYTEIRSLHSDTPQGIAVGVVPVIILAISGLVAGSVLVLVLRLHARVSTIGRCVDTLAGGGMRGGRTGR